MPVWLDLQRDPWRGGEILKASAGWWLECWTKIWEVPGSERQSSSKTCWVTFVQLRPLRLADLIQGCCKDNMEERRGAQPELR